MVSAANRDARPAREGRQPGEETEVRCGRGRGDPSGSSGLSGLPTMISSLTWIGMGCRPSVERDHVVPARQVVRGYARQSLRPQHSPDLAEQEVRAPHVLDHLVGVDDVEARRRGTESPCRGPPPPRRSRGSARRPHGARSARRRRRCRPRTCSASRTVKSPRCVPTSSMLPPRSGGSACQDGPAVCLLRGVENPVEVTHRTALCPGRSFSAQPETRSAQPCFLTTHGTRASSCRRCRAGPCGGPTCP